MNRPAGVALLGKQASRQQARLLAREWSGKPVVILLDGDARGDADRLDHQLRPIFKGGLVRVELPHGSDPGGYGRAELWDTIRQQAAGQGVTLPGVAATCQPGEPRAGANDGSGHN